MRRLARTASLLIAFWLLSAATAHAQSRWVLWHHDYWQQNWDRIRTSDTRKECEAGRPRFRIPPDGTLLVHDLVPGWCCLPDTVGDPGSAEKAAVDMIRAPKGRLDVLSAKDRDAVLMIAPCWWAREVSKRRGGQAMMRLRRASAIVAGIADHDRKACRISAYQSERDGRSTLTIASRLMPNARPLGTSTAARNA